MITDYAILMRGVISTMNRNRSIHQTMAADIRTLVISSEDQMTLTAISRIEMLTIITAQIVLTNMMTGNPNRMECLSASMHEARMTVQAGESVLCQLRVSAEGNGRT